VEDTVPQFKKTDIELKPHNDTSTAEDLPQSHKHHGKKEIKQTSFETRIVFVSTAIRSQMRNDGVILQTVSWKE
jgi:hypothetical protein